MQFKQWILNETDWPLFLTEGEEQVLALTHSILASAKSRYAAPGETSVGHLPGDEELVNDLKDLVELKYLPAFVFFLVHSNREPHDEAVRGYFDKLKTLVDKGKIKWAKEGQATVNGVMIDDNKGNQERVTDYLKFTEIIDGMYNLMKPSTRSGTNDARPVDAKPIFSENGLDIYEANSPQACIKYGEGYGFCISQLGGTMWQSYRDTQASTFYFVFDRTLDKSNPLHIVVVDITEHGPQVTDANNHTGNIAEYKTAEGYLNHLYGRGVPKDLFENLPKTAEEEEESKKLGVRETGLNFFKRLSYEEKSKYIGRGHELTDEQFDLLWDNNAKDLLNQYVNIGRELNDHQIEKVMTKKDIKETYLRKRWIAYEETGHPITGRQPTRVGKKPGFFSKLEFDNLKQEQHESIKESIKPYLKRFLVKQHPAFGPGGENQERIGHRRDAFNAALHYGFKDLIFSFIDDIRPEKIPLTLDATKTDPSSVGAGSGKTAPPVDYSATMDYEIRYDKNGRPLLDDLYHHDRFARLIPMMPLVQPIDQSYQQAKDKMIIKAYEDVFDHAYKKEQNDISELATQKLKEYAKSTDSKELLAMALDPSWQGATRSEQRSGSTSHRVSFSVSHILIKHSVELDQVSSVPSHPGTIASSNASTLSNYLYLVVNGVVRHSYLAMGDSVISRHTRNAEIQTAVKRLNNNNWPGVWHGETQAAQTIDILVKAGADLNRAKDALQDYIAGHPVDHWFELKDDEAAWYKKVAQFLIRYLDGLASPAKDVS